MTISFMLKWKPFYLFFQCKLSLKNFKIHCVLNHYTWEFKRGRESKGSERERRGSLPFTGEKKNLHAYTEFG